MMNVEEKKDERYTYVNTKPAYSSNVLSGLWFNLRCEDLPQSKTAVVPSVLLDPNKNDTACERHATNHQDDFTVEDFEPIDLCRNYIGRRVDKFGNSMAQRTSLKIMDAEKYKHNYMTMNTLLYDVFPKMFKEKYKIASEKFSKPADIAMAVYAWKPDRMEPFGNQCSGFFGVHKEPFCPIPTVYKRDYYPKFVERPKMIRKSDNIDRLA